MLGFEEGSAYQMFKAARPRLLDRPADISAVSLLGQAVSHVLDENCTDEDVRLMIADLEADSSNAAAGAINTRWELPLESLLGLLRQNMMYREFLAETLDPSAETLRAKVLTAIDAGVKTPTDIGAHVESPTIVVLRVLRELADEGTVEPAELEEGRRERPYRRVNPTDEGVEDAAESEDVEGPGEYTT
jgi:hypothetical protein